MAFTHLSKTPGEARAGVLSRIASTLSLLVTENGYVDVVEFAESKDYLGLKLYPRQKLILKLYYKVDLTDEELKDARYLLSAEDKYAKMYFPGLCQHHILGHCVRSHCKRGSEDYRILDDDELRLRLKSHHAHILEVIAGRRGSKSVLGAIVNAYEIFKLVRVPDAAAQWGLIPGQMIGTANVATDEEQAKGLFNQLKSMLSNSPWFQKIFYRPLEVILDFPGRNIFARSMHSNSRSVRGNTLIAINIDEFCFFNQTTGKQSDKAMWEAISPSTVTFKGAARIVITSSPFTKSGKAYELFNKAEEGEAQHIIAFQLACWEMNPTVTKEDPELASAYMLDPEAAEIEYGGQWADQAGQYIPLDAIDDCGNKDLAFKSHGIPGVKYVMHIDLALRRDRVGLVICHWDRERSKVVVDRVEEFDPKNDADEMVNPRTHEIDYELLYHHIVELYELYRFRFNWISFDQFNSAWLAQELRRKFGDYDGKWINEIVIKDSTNKEFFGNLRSLIVQGGIEYYRHNSLMKQLALLGKTLKPSGSWKIEAPPGFHDDLADALAAAAFACVQLALGIQSGVVTTNPQSRNTAKSGQFSSRYDVATGKEHHKDCDRNGNYCHYQCPVQKARRNM